MPVLVAPELFTRRLTLQPSTLNMEAGTVDVVLSTGAPVRRAGFVERLAIGPDNVELANRVPLLDAHRQTSINDIKGRVENIRHEGGAIVATLHVTDPDALAAISRGDVTGVSVGYRVTTWAESRDPATGGRIRTATKWELVEASLVPIPADPAAIIRSNVMEDEIETPEVTSSDDAAVTTRAEIRTICRAANIPAVEADALIDRGATVTEARAAAYEAITSRRPIIAIGRSTEDPAITRGLQAEALAATFTGAEPSEGARQFMGLGLLRHAAVSLTRAGVPGVATMGTDALATRALGSESDYPLLLNDAGNRVLMTAYKGAEPVLKSVSRQSNMPNFREGRFLRAGGLPNLKEVTEAGEIKHVARLESGETFKLKTYASIFGLTRQVIIDDDFGVLAQWGTNAGVAAANTEADLLADVLKANPILSDGKALFHVDHGNLGVGAAPDVDELSAARLAMRRQTGLDGKSLINATPKFLVVAADLETVAEQLLAALAASTVAEANPFSGKLTLLVEPRLPDGTWYVFADPASVPVLAYGYLSSAPGPQLASRDGWDVLGREFRVVLDFGAGVIDHRGAYRNPGEGI